ncbi:hypothetical protein I601_1262 [Nocardioides dokdonensis FR1436]|uniref:N-acetyltransferase domain-containing protein n=1 Tax=Nocardioides dokdonensis FR1436 TaxID=1300347 RepID=A0A1A9GHI6_9ACTN|nr:GNAT family N-acetyltransferase [Nocardioides dokdonensis]ANH37704.1 hypothetical protein I601_1262 [Nocardioides dokdonensis FR1436]
MSRKIVRITVDLLQELDAPCRTCALWQLDPVRRSRSCSDAEALHERASWLSEVLREWGSCGRVVLVDGRAVGHLLYAPPALVPAADGFATSPVSPDAVLLVSGYVDPAHTGGGLGRVLVQAMARDLLGRGGIGAVEAFGRATPPTGSPRALLAARPGTVAGCALPVGFLSGVGFGTVRAHPVTPRMRMDLDAALTWRDEVEAAIARLRGVVRPVPVPATQRSRPPSP